MNIQIVPVPLVDQIWPQVADGLGKSLKYAPDTSLGWVWNECRAGNAFLILVHDEGEILAATVWRFETWPVGVRFKCVALWGRQMKQWLRPLETTIRQMAKHGGATALAYEGRPGWERLFNARKVRAVYEVDHERRRQSNDPDDIG